MKSFLKFLILFIVIHPVFLSAQIEIPTIPDSPSNLLARTAEKEIYVQWDIPASDGGSALDGYNLNYKQSDSGEWMSIFTPQTNYVLLGLNLDVEYQIFVTAVNIVGESRPSETISVQMGPSGGGDNTPPVIVGEVSVSNISNDEATVSWTTDKPATSSIFYDVHRENQHGMNIFRASNTEHSIFLTNLLSCTTYFFVVGGEDSIGNTYTSNVEFFKTTGCIGDIVLEDVGELVPPDSVNNFSFDNTTVDIVADSGTVDRDSVFQIKRLSTSSVGGQVGCPAGAKPVGENIYDIKLIDNYDNIANLQKPITVTISYQDENINSVKEDSLSLYHYTDGVGWQKLQACVVDKVAKTISCEVTSFSKFMIAIEENCDDSVNFYQRMIGKLKNTLSSIDLAIKKFFWGSDKTFINS